MKRLVSILTILLFVVALPVAMADEDDKETKAAAKREGIDAKAETTLAELTGESPKVNELMSKAHGYAVFGNWKFAFGISGGGGSGVAVNKGSGERTYMKMGTAGVGLGFGGKKYQVVFLFENADRFNGFIEKGWQADASVTAAAGTASAGADTGFVDGIAVYQITESGLMAQADIAGTKYWKDEKLNEGD